MDVVHALLSKFPESIDEFEEFCRQVDSRNVFIDIEGIEDPDVREKLEQLFVQLKLQRHSQGYLASTSTPSFQMTFADVIQTHRQDDDSSEVFGPKPVSTKTNKSWADVLSLPVPEQPKESSSSQREEWMTTLPAPGLRPTMPSTFILPCFYLTCIANRKFQKKSSKAPSETARAVWSKPRGSLPG